MQNKKIVIYPIKELTIFRIDNFLSNELYQSLDKNLINFYLESFDNRKLLDKKNLKYCFNSRMETYKRIKTKYPEIAELDRIVKSELFYNFFFRKFFYELIKSKKNNFSQILRILKKPTLLSNFDNYKELNNEIIIDGHGHEKIISKEKNKFFNFFENKIEITIEYSYMLNNGKIVPHTDDVDKIFSLMLYFPKYENLNQGLFSQKERKIGTTFWKSPKKNFINKHLEGIEESEFTNNHEELINLPFHSNCLYGFIKNARSWHSVKKFDINQNYIRRSININIRFV